MAQNNLYTTRHNALKQIAVTHQGHLWLPPFRPTSPLPGLAHQAPWRRGAGGNDERGDPEVILHIMLDPTISIYLFSDTMTMLNLFQSPAEAGGGGCWETEGRKREKVQQKCNNVLLRDLANIQPPQRQAVFLLQENMSIFSSLPSSLYPSSWAIH